MVTTKPLDIFGHKPVLAVAVATLGGTNISVVEEVPDLVLRLEAWKPLLQSLLNRATLLIPTLNVLWRR